LNLSRADLNKSFKEKEKGWSIGFARPSYSALQENRKKAAARESS
jgi:hypothetical protein